MNQPLTKQQFAFKIQLWINHKRVLEKLSDHYKKPQVARSMAKVYDLYKSVGKDCSKYTMFQICWLVNFHEEDLKNILPVMTNRSYAGELEKLNMIIDVA